jgi:hypothetical protein
VEQEIIQSNFTLSEGDLGKSQEQVSLNNISSGLHFRKLEAQSN